MEACSGKARATRGAGEALGLRVDTAEKAG